MKYSKKIGLVIQVRSSSVRFKDKFLKKINNLSITKLLISRLKKLKKSYKIIIAIPSDDKKIYTHVKSLKEIEIFKGSKNDVLDRYYKCSLNKNLDTIIRLTGDNPLIDIEILDKSIKKHIKLKKYLLQIVSTAHFQMDLNSKLLIKNFFIKLGKIHTKNLIENMLHHTSID